MLEVTQLTCCDSKSIEFNVGQFKAEHMNEHAWANRQISLNH